MKRSTEKKQKTYWKITVAAALFLIVITFTPLVISPGKTDPKLFSMPFTLWVSMFIAILLIVLTYIGGRIHLKEK